MPIYFLEFLLLCIVVIYPLGKISLSFLNFKLTFWEDLLISLNIGIVLFTIGIFLLWRFGFYQLTFPVIILPFLYLVYFLFKHGKATILFTNISFNVSLFSILFFCIVVQSLITFQAGSTSSGGLKLPLAFAIDGMSYISLINNIQKSIPPQNPSYSGELVQNYHYLAYVFAAAIGYITKIPVLILNFKIISAFLTLLFTSTVYVLIKKLVQSKVLILLSVPFITLSSNYYYLVKYLYPSAYITPSVLWVDEYTTRLVNNQLLFSYIVILTILFLLLSYIKINRKRFIVVLSILIGSLVGIKVFGAVIFTGSFILLAFCKGLKKNFDYLTIAILSFISSVLIYLSATTSFKSILLISPFWFIKNIFETRDHLNYVVWELQRQTYLKEGNYIRILQLYFNGFSIFILGNLGGRLVGLFSLFGIKDQRKKETIQLIALMGTLGVFLPMIFIVKGTAWNTIQFFYYSLLSFGILTIIFIDRVFLKRKYIALILITLLWVSLVPGIIYSSLLYLNNYSISSFSRSITEAANFLNAQQEGTVLISPDYYGNAFVSALSKKNAFFADEMMLNVQLISYEKRKMQVINFFNNNDDKFKHELLSSNKIDYIFTGSKDLYILNTLLQKEPVFKNSEIIIYKLK